MKGYIIVSECGLITVKNCTALSQIYLSKKVAQNMIKVLRRAWSAKFKLQTFEVVEDDE